MISNNARLLLVIILSVGMAVFFLGSNQLNIIIGGSPSEREVSGPLGLKLGLDLQGGVHLIYEAEGESPTNSQKA